jgi:dTDP-4-amino-4,6-dideoxygalactose transaminase
VITFNRPYATGREFAYIQEAIDNRHLSGKGPFDERCATWLQDRTGAAKALLTGSCTSALEMAVMLAGIGPGDEVIVPSFTFVSTASAVALRGGTPVFCDIRPDTLNLDEEQVAGAVTERTKAILPIHYAGVAADMDAIGAVAAEHGLTVIEDAAQAILSSWRGRPLGSIGALGCLSFHETKNVTCGEGGALLVNDPALVERAEILQEKGTDRTRFFRGQVDKYTWIEPGSSFLTSEVNAAFLWAQLEAAEWITHERLGVWEHYHAAFAELEEQGFLRRPVVPEGATNNAHMYYLLMPTPEARTKLIADLAADGVQAVFHYVPLHSSPAGLEHGRAAGPLPVTDDLSARLVRLPLWVGMEPADLERVTGAVARSAASAVAR